MHQPLPFPRLDKADAPLFNHKNYCRILRGTPAQRQQENLSIGKLSGGPPGVRAH